MPPKIVKTVHDGLLVTSAVSTSGVYSASQYNFLQALASLRNALSPAQYDKFLITPVPDPSRNGVAELSRGIRGSSKRKLDRLSSRFEYFLQSILRFSPVINTLVSSKPDVAALIWGSVLFVITIALNHLDYFEQISRVFQKLGGLYPFFDEYSQLFPESDRLRESLADFYAVSVRCCVEALNFLQGSSRFLSISSLLEANGGAFGNIVKTIWKPFRVNFGDLDAELQRQQRIVNRDIQLASDIAAHKERQRASLFRSVATQRHLETNTYQDEGRQHRLNTIAHQDEGRRGRRLYRNKGRQNYSAQKIRLAKIENMSIRQCADAKKRKHEVLLAAISDYDHKPSFANACDKRHTDTGLWLFDAPEFKEWSQNKRSCGLWCFGIPGAGKTILAAGAIVHLFEHQLSPQVSISYFFCEYGIEKSTRVRTMLRSLIKQILSVFVKLSPEMEENLGTMFLGHQREPTMEELRQTLLSATELADTTYLIIDGLDECKLDDRNEMLSFINQLIRDSRSRVKIIISSRKNIDISRSLKSFSHLPLDSTKNHSDIEIYIREVIDRKLEEEVLKVGEPSMAEEIKKALIQRSDGMFLWVEFQIIEICRENNDDQIRAVLESLPKGLDETYSRILKRIADNHIPEVAKKVFTWLAVGRRPLSLTELSEAVAFDLGCLRWDQGKFQNDAPNMIRNCGNLVNRDKDGTIRFVHHTVLEFLVSDRAAAQFSLRKREANLYVGRFCVMYLNFPDFKTQLSSSTEDHSIPATADWARTMTQHNSLMGWLLKLHPRIRFLVNQAAPATLIDTQILQRIGKGTRPAPSDDLSQKFCLFDYVAKNWIHHCSELPPDDTATWNSFTNLVFHRKMPSAFDRLPWSRLNFNISEFYSTILLWAVEIGNSALVKAIFSVWEGQRLSVSAYIDLRNAEGQTPIQLASLRRNKDMLDDLISAGANVNAEPSDSGRTALQAAAGAGHLFIVNRLLEAEANINAGPAVNNGRTALQAAAGGGYLDIVNQLIEVGADINAKAARFYGRTALQAAAGSGNSGVVNRLIAAKASINAEPGYGYGRTALQAAAESGHLDVVNRLIEAGADVNARAAALGGRTALQAAVKSGHLDIVNRLIDAKADVNASVAASDSRTALEVAANRGHLDIVNRLIDAGADVNEEPRALEVAVERGHLDVVDRLIGAGADVNGVQEALKVAAKRGNFEIVDRLMEAGADANAISGNQGAPMPPRAATGDSSRPVVD